MAHGIHSCQTKVASVGGPSHCLVGWPVGQRWLMRVLSSNIMNGSVSSLFVDTVLCSVWHYVRCVEADDVINKQKQGQVYFVGQQHPSLLMWGRQSATKNHCCVEHNVLLAFNIQDKVKCCACITNEGRRGQNGALSVTETRQVSTTMEWCVSKQEGRSK